MNNQSLALYRGKEYEVKISVYSGKNPQIIFRNDVFQIYLNKNIAGSMVNQEVSALLQVWLRERAEEVFSEKTFALSKIIGVQYNNIRIKDTKTRWGSCSSKGNLNFNWRLIMAPEVVLDYIVIHELCHLRHMNHSKEFWDTVRQYMPDFEKCREWLKLNGMKLNI